MQTVPPREPNSNPSRLNYILLAVFIALLIFIAIGSFLLFTKKGGVGEARPSPLSEAEVEKQFLDFLLEDPSAIEMPFLIKIPPEIGLMKNLSAFTIRKSKLNEIPPEIGQVTTLESLIIYYGSIQSLPPEIGNLANLKVLIIAKNQLSSLPPQIGNLVNLVVMDLRYNNLTSLPPEIGNLVKLQRLHLGGNTIPTTEQEKIRGLLPNTEINF